MIDRLTAAVARHLVDLDHLAFLADGGAWDDLRFPRDAGGPAWRYRVTKAGVRVERSPAGVGLARWEGLSAIATEGLTPDRARQVRALAQLGWESGAFTPARLRKAGLGPRAGRSDVARAGRAVLADVIDAGIAAGGGEQLGLFGEAS
jgi:hypothetical protein